MASEITDITRNLGEKENVLQHDLHSTSHNYERAISENIALKAQCGGLESRLKAALLRDTQYKEELHRLQIAYNYLEKQNTQQSKEQHHRKMLLERQIDQLQKTNADLQKDLLQSQLDVKAANEQVDESKDRYLKLVLDSEASKRTHHDIVATLERQRETRDEEIERLKQEMAQRTADSEREKRLLKEANEDLKQQLSMVKDQLTNQTSTKESAPSNDNMAEKKDLLDVVIAAQSDGKTWNHVYDDFFKLQESHVKLIAEKEQVTQLYEQLKQEHVNEALYYGNVSKEVDFLREETSRLRSEIKGYEVALRSGKQESDTLRDELRDAEERMEQLSDRLKNTTYQLQHILQDIESRNDPFPENINNFEDLVKSAELAVTIDREKLVFKNVRELQEKNQELLADIRHYTILTEKLKQQLEEEKGRSTEMENTCQIKIQDAANRVTNLEQAILELQTSLASVTDERDKFADQLLSPEKDENILDKAYQSVLSDTRNRIKSLERTLAEKEQELTTQQETYRTLQHNYEKATLEIQHLQQTCSAFSQSDVSQDQEMDGLQRQLRLAQENAKTLETSLQQAQEKIAALELLSQNLTAQNTQLMEELKSNDKAHDRLLRNYEQVLAERIELRKSLEFVSKDFSSSTEESTRHIEELKSIIDDSQRKLTEAEDQLSSKEKELDILKLKNKSSWQDLYLESQEELRSVKMTRSDLEKQLTDLKQEHLAAQNQVSSLEQKLQQGIKAREVDASAGDEVEKYKQQLTEAESRVKALETEFAECRQRMEKEEAQFTEMAEKHHAAAQLMKSTNEKLAKELTICKEKLVTQQTDLNQTKAALEAAQTAKSEAEQRWQAEKHALTEEYSAIGDRASQTEAELLSLQEGFKQIDTHTKEVEARYRAEIDHLAGELSAKETEARNALEQLAQVELKATTSTSDTEQAVAASTEPKESVQQLWETYQNLVEQFKSELAQRRDAPIVDDSTVTSSAGTTGTMVTPDEAQALRDLNASLTRDNELWQTRYNETIEKMKELEVEMISVRRQLANVQSQNRELVEQRMAESVDIRNEAASYKDSNDQLRRTILQLNKRISDLETQISSEQAAAASASEDVKMVDDSSKERVAELEAKTQEQEAGLKEKEAQLQEQQARATEHEARVKELEAHITELKSKLETAIEQAKKHGQYAAMLKKRYTEINTQLTALKEVQATPTAPVPAPTPTPASPTSPAVDEQTKNYEALQAEKKKLDASLKKQMEEYETLKIEKEKAEAALEKRMNEYEALETKANDYFHRAKQGVQFLAIAKKKEAEVHEITNKVNALTSQVEELKTKVETADKAAAEARTRLKEKEQKVVVLEMHIKKLKAQIKSQSD